MSRRSNNQPYTLPGGGRRLWIAVGVLLVLYIALRALAWQNTLLLDDHDSISYIEQTEAYLTLDADAIYALTPDSTPFYPALSALASLVTDSPESGARLASLLCSVLLFVAVAGMARNLDAPAAMVLGLALLTILPYLITFSVGILSEPAYVAVVYCGCWYFLATSGSSSMRNAAGVAIVFGLAFLNRVEGILFLLLMPAVKAVYVAGRDRDPKRRLRDWTGWSLIYVAVFIVVAAPQVLVVSDKMNQFALNGRDVWAQILQSPDPGSFDEKIYGLDHSTSEINLTYLQRHPEALEGTTSGLSLRHQLETFLRNVDSFYAQRLGNLGGALLVAFYLFGLFGLLKRRRSLDTAFVLIFTAMVLAPALLTDPKPRALAVGLPMMAAVAGVGIRQVSTELASLSRRHWMPATLPAALLSIVLFFWLVPLVGIYAKQHVQNEDYSLTDLAPVREAVARFSDSATPDRRQIAARKGYLAYLTDSAFVPLPYTDYEGLVAYARANDVDLLYVDYRLASEFPFVGALADAEDWHLLYEGFGSSGHPLKLYAFR